MITLCEIFTINSFSTARQDLRSHCSLMFFYWVWRPMSVYLNTQCCMLVCFYGSNTQQVITLTKKGNMKQLHNLPSTSHKNQLQFSLWRRLKTQRRAATAAARPPSSLPAYQELPWLLRSMNALFLLQVCHFLSSSFFDSCLLLYIYIFLKILVELLHNTTKLSKEK